MQRYTVYLYLETATCRYNSR